MSGVAPQGGMQTGNNKVTLSENFTQVVVLHLEKLQLERDELLAHCEAMNYHLFQAIHEVNDYRMVSDTVIAELVDLDSAEKVCSQLPKQSLLLHDANVIETMFNEVANEHTLVSASGCELTGMWAFDYQVYKYCKKLIQQAKEGVK